jgi:hypothetical protein
VAREHEPILHGVALGAQALGGEPAGATPRLLQLYETTPKTKDFDIRIQFGLDRFGFEY